MTTELMMDSRQNDRTPWGVGAWWLIAVLIVVTVFCKIVPFAPLMPTDGLDESWQAAMSYAIAHHMSLGRDVISTFGPYAFLYTKTYHPLIDHLMMASSIYLAITYAFILICVMRGIGAIRLGCLWLAIVVPSLSDNVFYLYPLLVGVLCWSSSRSHKQAPMRGWTFYGLILVLFFPFGLVSLIKGSFMIICVAVTALTMAFFSTQRMLIAAVIVVTAFMAAIVLFWVIAGQSIEELPAYLHAMGQIAGGYTDAMSMDGRQLEIVAYLGVALFMVLHLFGGNWGSLNAKLFLVGLFTVYLFIAFKGGFVRHDAHALISASAVLLAASVIIVAQYSRATLFGFLATAAVYVFIVLGYANIDLSPRGFVRNIAAIYSQAWHGFVRQMTTSNELGTEYDRAMQTLAKKVGLPALVGETDIYSIGQSYLLASNSTWNPRPIIQSYSVYTPWLEKVNKEHLFEQEAPKNIWFKVEPIDGRIPSIEDGASWPGLLARYKPVVMHGDYLLLNQREQQMFASDSIEPTSRLTTFHFGERVAVPDGREPIVAEVVIKPSLYGKLLDVLYKRHHLQITVNLQDGEVRSYRIVAGMAESGFVISPLIENTREFAALYGNPGLLEHKRVSSFVIEHIAGDREWLPTFSVTLKKLKMPVALNVAGLLGIDDALDIHRPIVGAKTCDGSIDLVNGVAPSSRALAANGWLSVEGWLAKSVDQGAVPESTVLVLSDNKGGNLYFPTRKKPRPDVAAYFKKPALDMVGYTADANVTAVEGDYTLGLGYVSGEQLELCPQPKIPVVLGDSASERVVR